MKTLKLTKDKVTGPGVSQLVLQSKDWNPALANSTGHAHKCPIFCKIPEKWFVDIVMLKIDEWSEKWSFISKLRP